MQPKDMRKLLRYEPDTGKLYWLPRDGKKSWNTRFSGKEAFTATHDKGYKRGAINGISYYAQRVIWAIVHDEIAIQIDHINGNRTDNRIENLRSVDRTENARNAKEKRTNTSGVTGVSPHCGKWMVTIGVKSKTKYIGIFSEKNEAIAARKSAEAEYGYHQNHGRK